MLEQHEQADGDFHIGSSDGNPAVVMRSPNNSIYNVLVLAWVASPEATSVISEIYESCSQQFEDLAGERDWVVHWVSPISFLILQMFP